MRCAAETTSTTATEAPPAAAGDAPPLPDGRLTTDDLYGPSPDDRLTLVTSASALPWSGDEATVVVATLQELPFEPTPQGGRTNDTDGRSGASGAAAQVLLVVLLHTAAIVGAILAFRRFEPRTAYLLAAPPAGGHHDPGGGGRAASHARLGLRGA